MMSGNIEIIRGDSRQAVAYLSKSCDAVYFPGKNGRCISSDGKEVNADYSNIGPDVWGRGNYEPLYKGDTIIVTKEIVL